jgi:hypothetical protein
MKEVVELKPFDPEKELDPNKLFIYEQLKEVVVRGAIRESLGKGVAIKISERQSLEYWIGEKAETKVSPLLVKKGVKLKFHNPTGSKDVDCIIVPPHLVDLFIGKIKEHKTQEPCLS